MACSPLNVNQRFRARCRLHLQREALLAICFVLVFCLVYSSTLKIEVTYSSETSVYFQRATRPYIPEDRPIHNHRGENLKSYTIPYFSTLIMEVKCFSQTSVDFNRNKKRTKLRGLSPQARTTRRYIPEDTNLHKHRYENLKSCKRNNLCQNCCFMNRSIVNIRTVKNVCRLRDVAS
jgi:hypothetical protein